MGSFSCQYIDSEKGYCLRIKQDCIPGRPGCVLKGKYVFAIPIEERLPKNKEKKDDKNKKSGK
ncbi:hypothetical protein [Melioribacter sp. OK-6-Me]|uniref:hypothetical protein n=1 Tax=unclassified Melioribacter TaxID=2627329 RepID=UPI003ED8B464